MKKIVFNISILLVSCFLAFGGEMTAYAKEEYTILEGIYADELDLSNLTTDEANKKIAIQALKLARPVFEKAALDKKGYKSIEKPTFGSTQLIENIKANYNPDEIEIELIGLCTDICVVSNALLLKANFLETKVSVDSACCAGVTPDSHNAALTTMKMCQVNVI